MIVDSLLVLAGLVLLVLGGDNLVKGAVNLSLRLGVTPTVVGLTVVAFGTSAPEMLVSVSAALKGSTDIAMGNVVGSNIANVLVILGACAALTGIPTKGLDLNESWVMMMAASVVLIVMAVSGPIGRIDGLLLLAMLGLVLWRQLSTAGAGGEGDLEGADASASGGKIALWLAIGLVALPVGAQLLVTGATDIARSFGISEAVIGLTLVAVGTSLPELAASIASARAGRADMALGNVVGSNLFNILAILGITALIKPLPIPPQMLQLDLWVMLAASALLWPFLFRSVRMGKRVGLGLLAGYALYVGILL
ncbi:calcium/sodium antiporter [Paracoccus zhejiangensis]|uniref:Sodium:proton exchanger n=1 Tax=Paracoccus zhejiangensis TaxID=1077935 RepID=A0A2H5EU84_9RHOB|nr:calcium/sodium antiporter [Paracoccus zhejiangensis]AUH62856.1 sodium:proton exchanger [Paracoccus zhejiangensis]